MEIKTDWLEAVLQKHSQDRGVVKILSLDKEPAVGKGENFSSDLLRIKMKVELGSGRIVQKSVLLKNHPDLEERQKFLIEYHSHPIEIEMYSQIVPEIEQLMMEYGDKSDQLWCDCLSYKVNSYMLLQDLKDAGFRNEERIELLDLQHTLFVMRNIARLHAMSAVLLHKGRLSVNMLKPYCIARNEKEMCLFLSTGIRMLARVMRTKWGNEWKDAAEKVAQFSYGIGAKVEKLYNETNGQMMVLNHGDCWTNNIMFKHEMGTNIPTGIRFIDLQESHFNSYGWDVIFILKTSVKLLDRETKLDDILEAYVNSLNATFDFYGYRPENVPTVEQVKDEIGRLFLYGFVLSAVPLPIFMANSSDSMEIDDLLNEDDEYAMNKKMKMYLGEEFTEILKREVQEFIARDLC